MKFNAERLSRLEIDAELEFGRLDDGQVSGLLALENPSDINTGLTIGIRLACSIAHQTAGNGEIPQGIARRQRMTSRQRYELFAIGEHEWACTGEQSTGPALDGCRE